MPFAAGEVVGGRYTLERTLGRGATATVWLVRDGQTGDHVAMKVLHEELAESSARARFAREARRTSELGHLRIVPLLDAGEADGTLYFTQPYMPGGTLRDLLTREHQLSVAETLRIGREIAGALGHAHAREFVHRDVKPENILFAEGEAYLADFGISQAIKASIDESTLSRLMVRGTPAYMSPEQAVGLESYDGRSDIFSLGAVLYECLTGVPAFLGATADAVVAQVIAAQPRPLREYREAVPERVAEVIAKAMAKSPADRYRDAGEFEAALARPERRVTPRPGPVPPKPVSWGRIAVGAVIVIAVIGGLTSQLPVGGRAETTVLDTTRVAIFPIERAQSDPDATPFDDELIREGFRRASGVSFVPQIQMADAISQAEARAGSASRVTVARTLRAGRYVHGEVRSRGADRYVTLLLRDSRRDSVLHQWEALVPDDVAASAETFARGAAALLLRDASAFAQHSPPRAGWSVPALQAYVAGMRARDAWDLPRADSLLRAALSLDASHARIQYALAQVRAWMREPTSGWAKLAASAAAAPDDFGPRERRLVRALAALGARRFADACADYDTLRILDPVDFAAWYGLAQCRWMDDLVLPDPRARPTGWRFRSSHQAAFEAYTQALALLPSIHRGLEREGFDNKGSFVLLPTYIRIGRSGPPVQYFGARPSLRADTIAMIPYPFADLRRGGASIPDGFEAALAAQRVEFARAAAGWSASFPRGSEAKQAVALALELQAVPAAIDTIREARALANAPERRFRLAASEVRLLVRFGLPDDIDLLGRARLLVDSLLASPDAVRAGASEDTEMLAALRGRCEETLRIARVRPGANSVGLPEGALVESRVLLDRIAMQCDPLGDAVQLADFFERTWEEIEATADGRGADLASNLLMRPVLFAPRRDSLQLERLASLLSDPPVMAALHLARRDESRAIAALRDFESLGHPALPLTPDMGFIIARLWADVGDTVTATAVIDRALRRIRTADPGVLKEGSSVATILRLAIWRARLADAAGDGRTAQRWQEAVRALRKR